MQYQILTCKCCPDKRVRNYYRYYDTPDGCDIPKKMMVTSRYGLITGLIFGTYDVMMYSHAVGFSSVIKRYMLHAVPLTLIGATFAAVANGLLHFRQRDDSLNYFLGGLACGPLVAAYVGSGHGLVVGGLALGVAGMIKKDAIDNCWTLTPQFTSHRGTIRRWRNDYTLVPDPRDSMQHTCDESQ